MIFPKMLGAKIKTQDIRNKYLETTHLMRWWLTQWMETTDDASPVKLRGRRDLNILLEPRVIHIGGDEIKAQVLQRLAFFALRHFDLMWNQFCIKYTKCYEENEKRVFARLSPWANEIETIYLISIMEKVHPKQLLLHGRQFADNSLYLQSYNYRHFRIWLMYLLLLFFSPQFKLSATWTKNLVVTLRWLGLLF